MSITGYQHTISESELNSLRHPTENSRFLLALFTAIPVIIVLIFLVVQTRGMILIAVPVILISVWFGLQLMKASLMGSSVRVSPDNFPAVYEVLTEVKNRLNYQKDVEIYITEGGSFNAFLYKFFRTKFILLNADIISGLPEKTTRAEVVWLVARFIGALKAKHMRLQFLAILVNGVQQLQFFSLFMLPYERATQYTGDLIGLAVCGDLKSGIDALGKLMVGKDLGRQVELKGMLNQAHQIHRSLFPTLVKLLSTHPHMTERYLNMLGFARSRYPNEFARFAAQYDGVVMTQIDLLFPRYFKISEPLQLDAVRLDSGAEANVLPPTPAMAVLAGIEGPARGRRIDIQKSIFKIGSAPENDLIVSDDDFVSSSHAWLCYTEGDFIVVDQNSRNGTWINDKQVSSEGAKLKPGDRIIVGNSTFEIQPS